MEAVEALGYMQDVEPAPGRLELVQRFVNTVDFEHGACRRDACHWLCYDRSRNRSAVWCQMAVCGNRTKTKAYRARRV